VQDGLTFLGLLGVSWLFGRGEHRPVASYGIGRNRLSDVLPGAFWGLVMLSVVVFVLHAAHLLVFDGQNLHGAAILLYGLMWLLAFILVGFAEEYTFRGYVQFTLMRGVWGLAERISATSTRAVAFWIAATILSLGFACAHLGNGGENLFGLAQVFLAGIVFSYALWRTGSLWWGIGFHATWDWAQSFLFGVADSGNVSVGRLFITHPQGKPLLSGGADGPEGSIFATIALLVTLAIIHFAARGLQPTIEQQTALADAIPSPS
jgi:membrane protease YdiL (CAAX protease family)